MARLSCAAQLKFISILIYVYCLVIGTCIVCISRQLKPQTSLVEHLHKYGKNRIFHLRICETKKSRKKKQAEVIVFLRSTPSSIIKAIVGINRMSNRHPVYRHTWKCEDDFIYRKINNLCETLQKGDRDGRSVFTCVLCDLSRACALLRYRERTKFTMEIGDLERNSFARNDVVTFTKSLRGQRRQQVVRLRLNVLYGIKNAEINSSQNEFNFRLFIGSG